MPAPAAFAGRRFWRLHFWLPLAAWLPAVALCEFTDLDRRLSDPFYDFAAGRWRWDRAFWSRALLHEGGRAFIAALAIVALLVALAAPLFPRARATGRAALYLFLCLVAGTGAVRWLKAETNRFCPRAMDRYGGPVPYTHLFAGTPPGFTGGECFPSGHVSGPLSLLGLYFVARARGARRPALWLLPGFSLAALFALAQQARGAHFFSHNLWSLAIVWALVLALARLFGDRLAADP